MEEFEIYFELNKFPQYTCKTDDLTIHFFIFVVHKYIVSGGDIGRGVTCFLATNYPKEVKGIHLTDVGMIL